jgi:hypothetical protein
VTIGASKLLADAVFAEPVADSVARQDNDELVASFAQLFFTGLPEEQARSHEGGLTRGLLRPQLFPGLTSPQIGCNKTSAGEAPDTGDIISECPGDFVGIRKSKERRK